MSAVAQISLRAALAPAPNAPGAAPPAPPSALLRDEPLVLVGGDREPPLGVSVAADATSCFAPRGAALMGPSGPLWVCDTGHHRLLGWRALPSSDRAPADWVIGQADFTHEGRNGKGAVGAATFNVPTGICPYGRGMAVADAWNHRVLIWHEPPRDHNTAADLALGQPDFTSDRPNRGRGRPAADSFHWPYGVAAIDGRLFVADTGNRRVLVWDEPPERNGQAADNALGQRGFGERDENAGAGPSAMSMRWPHAMTQWRGRLCVADAGNSRVMVWDGLPDSIGAACDYVLGQADARGGEHNQSRYLPTARALNMPYGVAALGDTLIAADSANSRLLGWRIDDLETNAAARALFGQDDFGRKGDNRWRPPRAQSLCWPYGVQVMGDIVVVADTGNNRVSLWRAA